MLDFDRALDAQLRHGSRGQWPIQLHVHGPRSVQHRRINPDHVPGNQSVVRVDRRQLSGLAILGLCLRDLQRPFPLRWLRALQPRGALCHPPSRAIPRAGISSAGRAPASDLRWPVARQAGRRWNARTFPLPSAPDRFASPIPRLALRRFSHRVSAPVRFSKAVLSRPSASPRCGIAKKPTLLACVYPSADSEVAPLFVRAKPPRPSIGIWRQASLVPVGGWSNRESPCLPSRGFRVVGSVLPPGLPSPQEPSRLFPALAFPGLALPAASARALPCPSTLPYGPRWAPRASVERGPL